MSKTTRLKTIAWAIFLSISTMIIFHSSAQANLAITPTIITFKDGERYKDVTLINTSETTKTFQMSWRFFEMQETGASYQPIKTSLGSFDVSKYVFFTPRRVTIPAKGSQKVRMAFRRPAEMPEGDFHAHLLFSPAEEPTIDDGKTEEKSSAAGVSVKVGYSIPVVIRNGDLAELGKIGQIQITRSPSTGKLSVNVPISRQEGAHGVIAHLSIFHVTSGNKDKLVGEVSNANIFPEIKQRLIPVTLQEEVSGGSLKIVLKSGIKNDETIFDEQLFPLN